MDESLALSGLASSMQFNVGSDGQGGTLISEARQEAKNIILNANKLVENTISDIKSANADKEVTKNLREKLNSELAKNTVKPVAAKPAPDEIKIGDWVKLNDSETSGHFQ